MTDHTRQRQISDTLDAYQADLASQGDRQAFALLYRRWHPRGIRLARRLTGDAAEADDVMQDAALTIARDIRKLRDPARFSAWAFTIVRRRSADHIDRAVRRRAGEADSLMPETDMGPDVALSMKQALARLPETERTMLALFYLDGFRGHEIAAALGIPLGTVKSRLFKARQSLKKLYEGDDHD